MADAKRTLLALVLALAACGASARERATPEHRPTAQSTATVASEALRKRVAEQRYFDAARQAMRFDPPRIR